VVGVGVLANPAGVIAAGGFLAHLLPGADESTIAILEENVRALPHVSTLIRERVSPEQIVQRVAGALHARVSHVAPVSFACTCTRERVTRVLLGLGHRELDQMAHARDDTEVTCDFCGQRYYFSPQEIDELRRSASDAAEGGT
jgi:molecular chaperone Hsp33